MIKKNILIGILGLVASISTFGQTGSLIYMNYCSGCHGPNLEGGRASPLIKVDWKYGKDRSSITKVISNGIPNTEMAKWSEILAADEIRSVVDFIIKSQKKSPTNKKNKKN
jgi:aldose sugar dehydrogenase